jgi:hypothetical protein
VSNLKPAVIFAPESPARGQNQNFQFKPDTYVIRTPVYAVLTLTGKFIRKSKTMRQALSDIKEEEGRWLKWWCTCKSARYHAEKLV